MLILASASPRRKELLSRICENFVVIPSMADETIDRVIPQEKIPLYLSEKKAMDIFSKHPDDVVLGCDTGVVIDGKLLGKPKDRQDTFKMLSHLSGKTHMVITGCTILCGKRKISFSTVTEVEFYVLTDDEIQNYINTGESADKAGGYGIQGKGALFVKRINGDYFNVVGLPISKLNKKLNEIFQNI